MSFTLINDFEKALANIEQIIGQPWLEEWVHIMRDNQGSSEESSAPLALYWLKANDEVGLAQVNPCFIPSEKTLRLKDLADNLLKLKNVSGFKDQINLLKGDIYSFSQVCYRLSVAVRYFEQGFNISLASNLKQEDFSCSSIKNEEMKIITVAPLFEDYWQIEKTIVAKIMQAINKIQSDKKIIYLDLPLPDNFTEINFLNHITRILKDDNQLSFRNNFILTTTFVQNKTTKPVLQRNCCPISAINGEKILLPGLFIE